MKQPGDVPSKPSPSKKPDGKQLKETPSKPNEAKKVSRLEKSQEDNTLDEEKTEDGMEKSGDRQVKGGVKKKKKRKTGKKKSNYKRGGQGPYCRPGNSQDGKNAKSKDLAGIMEHGTLSSNRYSWKIMENLGAGGFGAVYKTKLNNIIPGVKQDSSLAPAEMNTVYAIKIELRRAVKKAMKKAGAKTLEGTADMNENELRLNTEAQIYGMIQKSSTELKHFAKMVDKGQTDAQKFIVMSLLGPSLDDIRKERGKEFSEATTVLIAKQALQGLRDFHNLGLVHRDLKPANFATGLNPTDNIIYLIDFGISKRLDGSRTGKSTQFVGTLKYAAFAAHIGKEMTEIDDLESLLYFIYDCWNSKLGLPWSQIGMNTSKLQEVGAMKMQFTCGDLEQWQKRTQALSIPSSMGCLDVFVGNLHKFPDLAATMHDTMDKLLDDVGKAVKMDKDAKFDWVEEYLQKKEKGEKSKIEQAKMKKSREDTKEERTKQEKTKEGERTDKTRDTVTESKEERTVLEKVKEEQAKK